MHICIGIFDLGSGLDTRNRGVAVGGTSAPSTGADT